MKQKARSFGLFLCLLVPKVSLMRLLFLLLLISFSARADGYTPILQAVVDGDNMAIEALLKKGANAEAADETGMTALMIAAKSNPDALVPYVLISNGANPNRLHPKTGWTALFYAVHYNSNPDVVRALITNGATINRQDIFGKTALDYLPLNPKLRDTNLENMLNSALYPSDSSASR